MSGRRFALVSALGVIVLLAALTIYVAARDGIDVIVIISLLIIALFATAIVGALRDSADE